MKWGRNIVLLAIFFTMALLSSCKDEIKSVVKQSTDPNKVPTVVSHDVQTIISDSGRTRYRITTTWHRSSATRPIITCRAACGARLAM